MTIGLQAWVWAHLLVQLGDGEDTAQDFSGSFFLALPVKTWEEQSI
nr:hypothetical protein [Methylacidiphilum caldifontis]